MAGGSVPQSQLREIVTCSLCFELFNSAEKLPKGLPCMHTFCLECLEKYVNNKLDLTLPCPLCQGKFTVPKDGVGTISTNILVKQIVETLPNQEKGIKGRCLDHQSEAGEFVCITCSIPLCDECMINLGAGPHSNHALEKMVKAVNRMRQEAKNLLEKAAMVQGSGSIRYETMRGELVSSKEEMLAEAKGRASRAHTNVNQWLSIAEHEIGTAFEWSEDNVQEHKDAVQSTVERMNDSLKKLDTDLDRDDILNASTLLQEMKQNLDSLEANNESQLQRDQVALGHLSDKYVMDLGEFIYTPLMIDTNSELTISM